MLLNIYYREKLSFSKLVGKIICRKENLKKCTSFEDQKGIRYIREMFILALLSSAVIRLQNCFVWEIKDFYQSSLG